MIHRRRATKGYYSQDGRVVVQERRGEVQLPSGEAAKRSEAPRRGAAAKRPSDQRSCETSPRRRRRQTWAHSQVYVRTDLNRGSVSKQSILVSVKQEKTRSSLKIHPIRRRLSVCCPAPHASKQRHTSPVTCALHSYHNSLSSSSSPSHPAGNASFSQLSLCLSRACLGKRDSF